MYSSMECIVEEWATPYVSFSGSFKQSVPAVFVLPPLLPPFETAVSVKERINVYIQDEE